MYIQNHNEAHCVQNTKTVIKVKKTLMEYFFRCFEEFKKDLLVFEQSSEKKVLGVKFFDFQSKIKVNLVRILPFEKH